MANTMLTISMITNEALMVLENELTFTSEVSREYDDQFAIVGAKIGATVNVRRPGRFIGAAGPALSIEDLNETSIPVTLTTQWQVATQFTTQDLALSLDNFSSRVLKPQVASIANKIDRDGLVMATANTANIVGTVGTRPSSLNTYLQAGAFLDSEGAPRDGRRCVVIDPFTSVTIVDALKGLFVPDSQIADQYRKGLMGRDSGGMNWKMDQNVVSQTFSAWATTAGAVTVTSGAQGLTTGWASSSTLSLTTTQTLTLQAGDVIQFTGINAVNPQNRQSYGQLRNFVVNTAVTATAGAFNVSVSPALISAGLLQNVTASPAAATVVQFTSLATGTANAQTGAQGILFHRNAYTLAMADLELPEGVHFAGRASDKELGLSIRIVRQYTINNDAIPTRLDVLYGWAPLYQELGCRITS